MNNQYSFKAFISYSHKDERWAAWLHRALESYRVPRKLVGTKAAAGTVPQRIKPVFRDRDDLSLSADLSDTVKQSLLQSENLIVVCSPHAAASEWVDREVREFIRLGRQQRIFCIIVDGEYRSAGPGPICFPPALLGAGLQEPLAADVRKWADGKHLARLKVIAAMLGLPLDQLRRRDLQKRQRTWALVAVVSIAVAAVTISAVMSQIVAQQRRDSGESLVAYKLTGLRTMLNTANDPENLTRLTQWEARALAELIEAAGDGKEALTKSAMDLRKLGQSYRQAGAFDQALASFQDSWALFALRYRQDHSDSIAFFQLGQSVYWIGRVQWDQGDLNAAEDAFMSYAEITRRLILLQPKNAEWVLEMSYALTNLGRLQSARDSNNPERILQFMQSALEYNQIALVLDPKNIGYQSELGQSHLNLADAQRNVCDLDGALKTMSESISLEGNLLQADPGNTKRMRYLAYALSGYANVQIQQGNLTEAQKNLTRSLSLIEDISVYDPEAPGLARLKLIRKFHIARLLAMQNKTMEAGAIFDAIEKQWSALYRDEATTDARGLLSYMDYLLFRSWLAYSDGDLTLAEQLLGNVSERLSMELSRLPGHREAGNLLALAAFQYWELKRELPTTKWLALLPDYSADNGRIRACTDADMAARKAIMLGDWKHAAELVTYLLNAGYHEPGFMRVCKAYSLCSDKAE